MLDTIAQFFVERPWRLVAVWVGVQFALICLWSWRRTPRTGRAVWIGFGVLPVLLSVSHLVTTQRERIITLCHDLAHHIDKGNAAGIEPFLSDDFAAADMDREAFLERLEAALQLHKIDHPRLRCFETTFPSNGTAVVEFEAACRVRTSEAFIGQILSRWRLTLRRRKRDWRVTSVEALPTPFSPIRSIRDWL